MKIQYANEFIVDMELGYPETFFYQFIFNKNESNEKNIIQYFIMHELGLCIKLNYFYSTYVLFVVIQS